MRCPHKAEPKGCQLHNLFCNYPKCDEEPATMSNDNQQAERALFEAWWHGSKYMQVVMSSKGSEQTAWDAWQARSKYTRFDDARAALTKQDSDVEPVAEVVFDRIQYVPDGELVKQRPQIFKVMHDEQLMQFEHGTKLYTRPASNAAVVEALRNGVHRLEIQIDELIGIAERHCWTTDEAEKRMAQVAIDYARKVKKEVALALITEAEQVKL